MKPKLLLLVVPFVFAGLLQGCFGGLCSKGVPKRYNPNEEPDCYGYSVPIITGSTAVVLGVASGLIYGVMAPSESDTCEEMFCTSPRKKTQFMGGFVAILAAIALHETVFSLESAHECNERKKTYEKWLSGLTPDEIKEHRSDQKRKRYIKRCEKLKEKYEKLSCSENLRIYYTKCRKFIKKDINTPDIHGRCDLHRAVMEGSERKVKRLLKLGAYVSAKDKWDWTPLHYAALSGSEDIVEILLKKGAETTAKDEYGRTPLDVAVEKRHDDVVELLKNAAGGGK